VLVSEDIVRILDMSATGMTRDPCVNSCPSLRALCLTRCERADMEECALHLVVLAHAYVVPALKRLCTIHFEQGRLNIDNVVDILLIARYFFSSLRFPTYCSSLSSDSFGILSIVWTGYVHSFYCSAPDKG